jgi:hypothetical protein
MQRAAWQSSNRWFNRDCVVASGQFYFGEVWQTISAGVGNRGSQRPESAIHRGRQNDTTLDVAHRV